LILPVEKKILEKKTAGALIQKYNCSDFPKPDVGKMGNSKEECEQGPGRRRAEMWRGKTGIDAHSKFFSRLSLGDKMGGG